MKTGDRYYLPFDPLVNRMIDTMTAPIVAASGFVHRDAALLDTSCICDSWELLADDFDGDRRIPVRRHYRDGGFDYDIVSEADLASKVLIPPLPTTLVATCNGDGRVTWQVRDGLPTPGVILAESIVVGEAQKYDFVVHFDRFRVST